jgi:hypothetical protein
VNLGGGRAISCAVTAEKGKIRAFVGHSFTDHDKAIVGQFVEFFETLAKVNQSFSWTHPCGSPVHSTDSLIRSPTAKTRAATRREREDEP